MKRRRKASRQKKVKPGNSAIQELPIKLTPIPKIKKQWYENSLTVLGIIITIISILVTAGSLLIPENRIKKEKAEKLIASAGALFNSVEGMTYTEIDGNVRSEIGQMIDRAASEMGEEDRRIQILRAKYLLIIGDKKAPDQFKRLTKKFPDSVDAAEGLGLALRADGKFEEAIEVYRAALQKHPNNISILLRLADAYITKENYNDADVTVKAVLSLNPLSSAAHVRMGTIYENKGDLEQGRQAYEAALQYDAKSSLAHERLGLLALREDRNSEAISHLQSDLILSPRNCRPHLGLGIAYYRTGNLPQALKELATARECAGRSYLPKLGYVPSVYFPENKSSPIAYFNEDAAETLLEMNKRGLVSNLDGFENIFLSAIEFSDEDSPDEIKQFEDLLASSCIAVATMRNMDKAVYKGIALFRHKRCLTEPHLLFIIQSKALLAEEQAITESAQQLADRIRPPNGYPYITLDPENIRRIPQ